MKYLSWKTMLALAAFAAVLALPVNAQANIMGGGAPVGQDSCVFGNEQPTFKGWATVDRGGCGGIRTMDYRYITAWQWNGAGWVQSAIGENTPVYHHPFTTGWAWIWTQRSGWLAIKSENVLIVDYSRRYYG